MALATEQIDKQGVADLATELLALVRKRDTVIREGREEHFEPVRTYMKRMRESIRLATQIDPAKIAWGHPGFSIRTLARAVEKNYRMGRLREANAETTFGQLLRYGVQHYLFDAYQNVETVMEAVFDARPSGNRQEWYAPLYGAEVPEDVDSGGKFDDSRIRGLDVVVINKKVGRILSIERELVDDDQTGQIVQRASRLGERMRYKEELDGVLAVVNAGDYSNGLPAGAGYTTTIGNKGANAALSQPGLEGAAIALRKIKDPLGNFMLVQPDTVLVGPDEEINLYKLLNSAYQPAIPGTAPTDFATAGGQTGWTLTANWLQGRFTPVVSTFFAHPSVVGGLATAYWYVLQAKRGLVLQNRDPLEVVQENPLSGQAFEFDAYRYRVRRRYKHQVIEPRFIYQGKGSQ